MKRRGFISFTILFLLIIFIFSCAKKNDNVTSRLFNKYDGKPGFYLFDIPPYLISMFIDDNTEENKQLKQALGKLNNIKILLFRTYNEKIERKDRLFMKFDKYFSENQFDNLTRIGKYKENLILKYMENDENPNELIILFSDKDSFIALSLTGNFDYNTFTTLLKFENIETLKNLKDR